MFFLQHEIFIENQAISAKQWHLHAMLCFARSQDQVMVREKSIVLKDNVKCFPEDKFWTNFADDYFKFDENGRKFSKQVQKTVGKGEIARNECV